MKTDYFYGAQVERLMKHLVRLFSNFSVQDGYDDNGAPSLRRVPCRVGDISRQAAVVLHENSENKLPSAPFITVTISNMNISRQNVRAPMTEQTVVGVNKQNTLNELEGYYEVERFNPVPWDFEIQVDIWTTNQQNKFELFEQIATLFTPTVPLQMSTNPLDPTSYGFVELTGYNHTSRSFPQGNDYNLDISQFQFKTMIYLSLPSKVNRAQLISQIVTDINVPALNDLELPTLTNWQTVATDVYSPGNHMIEVSPVAGTNTYNIKLLTKHGLDNVNHRVLSWDKLFKYYSPTESDKIQLRLLDMLENDSTQIIGELLTTPQPNVMLFVPDRATVDMTTTEPFNEFIDPKLTLSHDLVTSNGVARYIIHEQAEPFSLSSWVDLPEGNTDVVVQPGSMVAYDGTVWSVIYTPGETVVTDNLLNGRRYKYLKQIGWHEIIKTKYAPGFWRLGFSQA